MIVLVVLLLVTNVVTMALLVLDRRTRVPDPSAEAEVFEAPRPAGMRDGERRLVTVELLDPIEVARGRAGRVAGIAGSLAPRLTRRFVYEQTVKALRQELTSQGVHADVRVHVLRSAPRASAPRVVELEVVDEVAPLDLTDPTDHPD